MSPYQKNVEEYLQEVRDNNKNKALHNRILSPLRIISPGRNQRHEPNPNLKAAANANPVSREMRRVTSAKQIEVNVKSSNMNFGGTMYGNIRHPKSSSEKLENLFLKNNNQHKVDINEFAKKQN